MDEDKYVKQLIQDYSNLAPVVKTMVRIMAVQVIPLRQFKHPWDSEHPAPP